MSYIAKIGGDHLDLGINCQDSAYSDDNILLVCDGCGSGEHSEVGAQLFTQIFPRWYDWERKRTILAGAFDAAVKDTFRDIVFVNGTGMLDKEAARIRNEFIFKNLLFTIICYEKESGIIYHCGDGFVIDKNTGEIKITYDDGNYPKYYGYNYVAFPEDYLTAYQDGVDFGAEQIVDWEPCIASDGYRYVKDLSVKEQIAWNDALKYGKNGKMKMVINRNQRVFKDDISLAF
jgi:hypothetical protein